MSFIFNAIYRFRVCLINFAFLVLKLPRPLLFVGPDSSLALCQAIAQEGTTRLLVVTDAGLMKLGLLDRILSRLKADGVECFVYDGVEPNPSCEQIESGLAKLDRHGCQAVLSVGGGSSIDAAKVIVALAASRKPIGKLIGTFKVRGKLMHHYAIPTTAGTGAEVTVAAVISKHETREKLTIGDPKLVPKMAALDAKLMLGLPPAITAATGMDALTHAIEAYLSTIATAESDEFARMATRLVFANLLRAYDHGQDLEARSAMALASTYGGLAFTRALVGYVHAIAHNFGGMYHTPHGLANAIVLPYVLEFSRHKITPRLAELAIAAGIGTGDEPKVDLAERFIQRIRGMNAHMKIPAGLEALREQDIPLIAARALKEAHGTYAVPLYMSRAECETLLRRMMVQAGAD